LAAGSGVAPTYRDWMRSRGETAPSPVSLEAYLAAGGPEWWQSERKEAVSSLGDLVGPRKAVAGLANRYGGEVLLGVTDRGSTVGTPITWEQIEAALQQPAAVRSAQYIVDLTLPIRVPPTVVPLAGGSTPLSAYVIEVVEQALPAYVWDERQHRFELFVRFAGATRSVSAFDAMEWMRERTRAKILVTVYREFDTISKTASHEHDYSVGFIPALPYLQKCMDDGSFYAALSPADRTALLGEALGNARSGGSQGFVGGLLRLPTKMAVSRRILEQGNPNYSLQQVEDALWTWYSNTWNELKQQRDAFRAWLVAQGIRLD
jgi:hypothetical protein